LHYLLPAYLQYHHFKLGSRQRISHFLRSILMITYRNHYYPNTEQLMADEMRIIALGTGRPTVRPAQANAGWLVELGNGDRFMLDFVFGTQPNFSALEIP